MQSDIVWGSLFKLCAEHNGILEVRPEIEKDGYTVFLRIPSKKILLKQELPNMMSELESIKYIENEVVKNFKHKLNELVSIKLKEG